MCDDSVEEIISLETPVSKSDGKIEGEEDKQVKRTLADEFSSTLPRKKTKTFIKKEK